MPRISAASVAEHHAVQRRAVLDATRALLSDNAAPPSMSEIGRRAGLARSSVYQYFPSAEELFAAVVAELFQGWTDQVRATVEAASTPALKVWAYVRSNIELVASSEQAAAQTLTRVVEPQVLQGPMEQFHSRLQVPLREALSEFGDPEPQAMADLLDSLIVKASRDVGSASRDATAAAIDVALDRLRRLLAGYLHLDPDQLT